MTAVAVRAGIAVLTGAAGLLFETASVRRFGLLLGNTATASAVVLSAFLLGLGLGGWWLARSDRARRRGAQGAGVGYLVVGVLLFGASRLLGALDALGSGAAIGVVAVTVVLPSFGMGAAFPLLFAGLQGRAAPGVLVGANLLGSVVAAYAGALWAVPQLGMLATSDVAAGGYVVAGLLARSLGRDPAAAAPGPVLVPRDARARAFAAGLAVLALEVVLLRRLPFYLEGFQPTLAGVLASCLLFLAVGSAASGWLGRAVGDRASPHALIVGGLLGCLGLHELAGPALMRLEVASDLGLHFRVFAVASLSAGPACLALGAVVPLEVARFEADRRDAASGVLFCWQGIGSVCGAVLVGHVIPPLAPTAFFVVALPICALGVLGLASGAAPLWRFGGLGALVVALALGLSGPGSVLAPGAPVSGSRFDSGVYVPLGHATDAVTTASVAYDRKNHSMVLFTDEFRAAYTGPGTSYMQVLGHLPFLLRDGLRDVAVIAFGTGTTVEAVTSWPDPEHIDIVELSPAVLSLADWFAGDGPVRSDRRAAFRTDPRVSVHVTDGRRWLATREAASLDLVTMEPLLPYAPGTPALYSREFYEIVASRLRDAGLCVQWVPTHAMPRAMFETLLATFDDVFDSTSVWLIDQSTLLVGRVGGEETSAESIAERLAGAPPAARRTLHEAGLAGAVDLAAAAVGRSPATVFAGARRLDDERPFLESIGYWSGGERLGFLGANLDALIELADREPLMTFGTEWTALRRRRLEGRRDLANAVLDPGRARGARDAAVTLRLLRPESVLLHLEERNALRQFVLAESRLRGPEEMAGLATALAERDAGCAELHVIGASTRGFGALELAAQLAVASDPTFYATSPYASLLPEIVAPERGPLEDLAELPEDRRLAEQVARGDARAVALIGAYPVRCAEALIAAARQSALGRGALRAMRRAVDPATLQRYADAVVHRGGDIDKEILTVWRSDLPVPTVVSAWARGAAGERARLAEALAGRRARDAAMLLAELLLDGDLVVRRAAAASLARGFKDIAFDPEWEESRRSAAAQRLRELHNPAHGN